MPGMNWIPQAILLLYGCAVASATGCKSSDTDSTNGVGKAGCAPVCFFGEGKPDCSILRGQDDYAYPCVSKLTWCSEQVAEEAGQRADSTDSTDDEPNTCLATLDPTDASLDYRWKFDPGELGKVISTAVSPDDEYVYILVAYRNSFEGITTFGPYLNRVNKDGSFVLQKRLHGFKHVQNSLPLTVLPDGTILVSSTDGSGAEPGIFRCGATRSMHLTSDLVVIAEGGVWEPTYGPIAVSAEGELAYRAYRNVVWTRPGDIVLAGGETGGAIWTSQVDTDLVQGGCEDLDADYPAAAASLDSSVIFGPDGNLYTTANAYTGQPGAAEYAYRMVSLDRMGTERWSHPIGRWPDPIVSGPAEVSAFAGDTTSFTLQGEPTGQLLIKLATSDKMSVLATPEGTVVFGPWDDTFVGVRAATPTNLGVSWESKQFFPAHGLGFLTDKHKLVLFGRGHPTLPPLNLPSTELYRKLAIFDAKTGALESMHLQGTLEWDPTRSTLTRSGMVVATTGKEGAPVYAIALPYGGPANGGWPMVYGNNQNTMSRHGFDNSGTRSE